MYRDDLEAARARAEALERENHDLKELFRRFIGEAAQRRISELEQECQDLRTQLQQKTEGLSIPEQSRIEPLGAPALDARVHRKVEVACNVEDALKGYIELDLRELTGTEGNQLLRTFAEVQADYNALLKRHEAPGRSKQEVQTRAEIYAARDGDDKWARTKNLLDRTIRDICFLGVAGYELGQLKYKGNDLPYSTEEREVLGEMRIGISSPILRWLEASGCSIQTVLQILRISNQKPALTKEKQWQHPEKALTL